MAACDDGDACTMGGSCGAGVCDPRLTIMACIDGDGCCAAGCNYGNDDDCEGAPVPVLSPVALFALVSALVTLGGWVSTRRRRGIGRR